LQFRFKFSSPQSGDRLIRERGTVSVATIGLYSVVHPQARPFGHHESQNPDIGASRMLLEAQLPFLVLDEHAAWSGLELVILQKAVVMTPSLTGKVRSYIKAGGKVVASAMVFWMQVVNARTGD
jgi:hypothetical protein